MKANTASDVWADLGLPLEGQRGILCGQRRSLPHPSQEAAGQADGEEHRPGQRRDVEGPRRPRARLRPAERANGARGAHDWLGQSPDEDRTGQSDRQHESGSLAHWIPDEDRLRGGTDGFSPRPGPA